MALTVLMMKRVIYFPTFSFPVFFPSPLPADLQHNPIVFAIAPLVRGKTIRWPDLNCKVPTSQPSSFHQLLFVIKKFIVKMVFIKKIYFQWTLK